MQCWLRILLRKWARFFGTVNFFLFLKLPCYLGEIVTVGRQWDNTHGDDMQLWFLSASMYVLSLVWSFSVKFLKAGAIFLHSAFWLSLILFFLSPKYIQNVSSMVISWQFLLWLCLFGFVFGLVLGGRIGRFFAALEGSIFARFNLYWIMNIELIP